ncbi:MAG: alpha/beta hydrolase [Saprospiraceae bacterium]
MHILQNKIINYDLNSRTIVFIHGLFMNQYSWLDWIKYFTIRKFRCHAPPYPCHDGVPSVLRQNIPQDLGSLDFGQVVDHYRNFLKHLPEQPILIGHSMGGLIVQKLMMMNLGVAGICIAPAPPAGVFTVNLNFFILNSHVINPFKGDDVCLPRVRWFHRAFCNTTTLDRATIEYKKWVVPESRNIPRSILGHDGRLKLDLPHHPMLFIAGERDHLIPSTLVKANFNRYTHTSSITDFKMFFEKTHLICLQPGWEEVAEFIYDWIVEFY